MKKFITTACVLASLTGLCNAQIIAQWTFETSVPAATDSATISGIVPEVGTGTGGGTHASATTDYTNPPGNGSAESFSSNAWALGDYYQFQVSTLTLTNISVSFDQTRSSTGPGSFDLQYSTDGSAFSLFQSYSVAEVTWSAGTPHPESSYSFDLSSITAINNAPTVYFRLTATVAGSATNGTNRVDNVTISSVPEPQGMALAVAGLLGLVVVMRGRMRRA